MFLGKFVASKAANVRRSGCSGRILLALAWRIEKVEEEEPQTAGDKGEVDEKRNSNREREAKKKK